MSRALTVEEVQQVDTTILCRDTDVGEKTRDE